MTDGDDMLRRYKTDPSSPAGPTFYRDSKAYGPSSKARRELSRTWEQEVSPTLTPRDAHDVERGDSQVNDLEKKPPSKVSFRERIKHFTWAWYTLTMSTGGVATLISVQPHQFPGLLGIGAFFYILNLVFFVVITSLMVLRWTMHPGSLKESLKHPREGLFFGPFWLSIATIITGFQKYIVASLETEDGFRGWLTTTVAIAFWVYTVSTFLVAWIQYSYLFNSLTYNLQKFMPSWLLPIFPIMLAGTIASVIAADQPLASRYPILVAGLGCQGLGFTVSILMYAHYIGRLMQSGLPDREHRGAMFIGVGPPSFTALALIGMANALPADFSIDGDVVSETPIIRTMAIIVALSLWLLAAWFFIIAATATLLSRPKDFHLGWWAMVFPNSGFTIATISIGNALGSEGIRYVANGMTIGIVAMWCFVLFFNLKAVWIKSIMWPGRDEDVEDH